MGGCAGFGNLGGLGFANGGSSGFQPQGTYSSPTNTNGTPSLNGVGGGGGGAGAVCISGPKVTSPTCTQNTKGTAGTAFCGSTVPTSSSTCVLAIAGGGGGGGTDYSASYTGGLSINTNCTAGSGLSGGGGLIGQSSTADPTADGGNYYPGVPGPGGGSTETAKVAPTSGAGYNPGPTNYGTPPSGSDTSVGNGGNGGYYSGSGYSANGVSLGGIGAGGGGGGLQGGWADPWNTASQSVPTEANPTGGYLSGSGSAGECGAGGGSSWLAPLATNASVGNNNGGSGTITLLQLPTGTSSVSGTSGEPIFTHN